MYFWCYTQTHTYTGGMLMQVQTSSEVSLCTTTHSCGRPGSRTTVSEFSNSHWRHLGWEGHSYWMVRHMHAHKLTHRCSLFSQAAINLHARGYESICRGENERETESQRRLFKVNRVNRSPLSSQIYWTGSWPQLSHAWVGQVMDQGGGGVGCVFIGSGQ